jgi:hypothetical protein
LSDGFGEASRHVAGVSVESSKFSADRWFSLRMAAAKMAASSVCGDVAGESDMELPMVALLVDAKQGTRNVAEDDPPAGELPGQSCI